MAKKRKLSKLCLVCAKEKPLRDFVSLPCSPDGRNWVCKPCHVVESAYRAIKARAMKRGGKNFKNVYRKEHERTKNISLRYLRLYKGMTPREAAIDEIQQRIENELAQAKK